MAAHKKSLIVLAALLCVALLYVVLLYVVSGFSRTVGTFSRTAAAQSPPQRIVSIVPSVTEMLFAIGAGSRVVGVGTFDKYPPEALTRTKVGGLIDPDIERIISLEPDLVIVYGTQSDLRTQMTRAGIPIFLYRHSGLPDITETIRDIGKRVGHVRESAELANRIDAEIADIRRRVSGRSRPRTLLVFGRDAETLRGIYASGGIGFLHDMLEAAGGANVFADVKRESIQTTSELAITRAPEAIIEIGVETASSGVRNLRAWDALPSVPAVRNKRIYLLTGDAMMNPGPRVSQSARRMAEVLHPGSFTEVRPR
jgi:iron complex transport system substrate-binding protein